MPNKYPALIENMPDAFAYHQMVVDDNGNPVDCIYLNVNPAFTSITGLSREKIIGKRVSEFFPCIKEKNLYLIEICNWVATSGESTCFNQHFKHTGKTYAITIYSDQPGYFVTILRDVTENLRIQEELQRRENELQKLLCFQKKLLETAPIWINILDEYYNVVSWNKAAEKISGYSAQEVIRNAETWKWFYPNPDHKAAIFKNFKATIRKGKEIKDFEAEIRRKDGHSRTILWQGSPLVEEGRVTGSICIGLDITERKLAEKKLRDISDEYEKVFQGTQNAMFLLEVIDPQTFRYIKINQTVEKATGFSAERIRGKTSPEVLGETLWHSIAPQYRECVQSGTSISYEIVLKNKTWLTTLTPIFLQGEIKHLFGSSQDISARRQVEERHRLLVRNANDSITVAQDGYIKFANPRTLQLLALSMEEITSIPFADFFHPDDLHIMGERNRQKTKGNKPAQPFNFRIIDRDGKIKFVSVSSVEIEWEGLPAWLSIATDITAIKKAEEEMLRADKLESIGLLASGIAHDFNNYLATLLANVSLAKMYKEDYVKLGEKLANMERVILRARDLSNRLFTFAQGGVPLTERISIHQLITDDIGFALSGTPVRPHINLAKNLSMIEADASQLSQVLNNIVINAVHAMPEGGTLVVRAANADLPGTSNFPVPLPAGPYVKIIFKDSGIGIPPKYLRKIFDPFFTTKDKGRGLGLATTYSIIKKHGGYIDVESASGAGTTFTIYLPAIKGNSDIQPVHNEMQQGSGKILIMDDEKDLLHITGESLSSLGYDVALSGDGANTIELYSRALEENQPFDLVILDLTIPGGMGGRRTLEKLKELNPAVKAIVASGYSNDPVMAGYQDFGFRGMIKKPFTMEELSKMVGEVIR